MSGRTRFITPQIWGKLKKSYTFGDIAKKIESCVNVTDRYSNNVENDLRAQGEHKLADWLIDALEGQTEHFPYEIEA